MHNFKKQFGQNFLTNSKYVIDLVDAAQLTSDTRVLEIGPGDGAVTEFLIGQSKDVTSVEIDSDLIAPLSSAFAESIEDQRYTIIHDDILRFDPVSYFGNDPYTIVGSLPYNISKQIVNKFITGKHAPTRMSLILQKEVAQDYTTTAPKASFLHTITSLYADCNYVATIPASDFYPQPKVDGGIMTVTNIGSKYNEDQALSRFIKIGFSAPRKKLSSNLSNAEYDKDRIEVILQEMNHSMTARAGELPLADWITMYESLS